MTRAAPALRLSAALLSVVLLGLSIWLAAQLIGDLRRLQQDKTALAELRDVKYGLFNAELWVEQLGAILAHKIDHFRITEANRPELKRAVEQLLDRLLREIEDAQRRRHAAGDHWIDKVQGAVQQQVQDWLIDFDRLRARVPVYAEQVLLELEQPRTREELKGYLTQLLEQATASSLAEVDDSAFNAILAHYHCDTGVDCAAALSIRIDAREQHSRGQAIALLNLLCTLFALNLAVTRYHRRLWPEGLTLLTGAVLVLLAVGVLTPMIEIEARITELSFVLLDQPVRFTDQVLYFQSKSLLDVVTLLARTGAADMLLVAVLNRVNLEVRNSYAIVCAPLCHASFGRALADILVTGSFHVDVR
ncbi:hypothetical protein, partial [Rhabdochromatium marinum]|uniref:hypothetical protein n=1 Tax=Rhabdochromatium marinum TaxID=48729 RepID=UPI001905862E